MEKRPKILLVDDDPWIAEAYSGLLRARGHEVWSAGSGQQAIQLAQTLRPDVIILDVMLPDESGIEVCRKLKADPALADTFVVMLSGMATGPDATVRGLETGADDYISKDVAPAEFIARIGTAIRLRDTAATLREREQHYHGLVEILPDAVVLVDGQGRILSANPQALSMLEFNAEAELFGISLVALCRPEDRTRMQTELKLTLETGAMRNAEYVLCTKGGGLVPVELSAVVTKDGEGNTLGLLTVLHDSTERKRSERLLRERAEFNRRIITTAMDGFWLLNLHGRLLDVNEAYCAMSGYSLQELLTLRISDIEAIETTPEAVADHIAKILKTGGDRFETRHRRKDGRIMDVEVSTTHLDFGSGYLVAFLRDITQRKQTEDDLKRLPRRILEAQEAERLRVSRELHDGVNQLIASAKMRLHGVLEDGDVNLRPSAREILGRCERMLVRALEENRVIAHNLRPSDLDDLGFEAACRSFCREFGARTTLKVKCRIPRLETRLPPAVELSLFRILQEALNNVAKHAGAATVRVTLTKKQESVALAVRDDGRGMKQAKPSRASRGRNGLGLIGMKERVALLGGHFELDSTPEKGTMIKVTLPRTAAV